MVWSAFLVLIIVFSYQGTFSTLQNEEEIQQGFCQNETKKIVVALECDFNTTDVVLEAESSNYIVQCLRLSNGNVRCNEGSYNSTHNWLEFNFTFDQVKHAGKTLRITSTCSNGTILKESTKLLPCLGGFTATATHNETDVCIVCKHTSFRLSKGISIMDGGTELYIEKCWWNKISQTHCHQKTNGHRDGIDCYVTTYTPGTTYYCDLDGQRAEVIMQEEKDSTTSRYENSTNSGGVNLSVHSFFAYSFNVLLFFYRGMFCIT